MKEIKDGTPETQSHWKQFGDDKPILCVDFHHVITTTCEACRQGQNYTLQKGAKEALEQLSKTFRIVIFTGNPSGLSWLPTDYKVHMEEWLRTNGIPFSQVLFTKPPACFIIDDRAIHHLSWAKQFLGPKLLEASS